MPRCEAPLAAETLLDYWAGDLAAEETGRLEEHLFECSDCAARLDELASIGAGLRTLAERGRLSGIGSRALVNRLQRAGVRIRDYTLSPGEMVPCTVFPGDELVLASMRADFTGVNAVTLSVSVLGSGGAPVARFDDVPVPASGGEVIWMLPAAVVRGYPSLQMRLTLTSSGPEPAVLGQYTLDHTAAEPPTG